MKPEWIKTTDRLPGGSWRVLFVITRAADRRIGVGHCYYAQKGSRYWFDEVTAEAYEIDHVSHWTPFPEMP